MSAVVNGVVEPLAWGPDGDQGGHGEGDEDFEEKSVRLLYTYLVVCKGVFKGEEKEKLGVWVGKGRNTPGEEGRWGLTEKELEALTSALA